LTFICLRPSQEKSSAGKVATRDHSESYVLNTLIVANQHQRAFACAKAQSSDTNMYNVRETCL